MESRLVIDQYGTKCYYNDKNQLHREDGPAQEWSDGTKSWYIDGEWHREDGPAIELANGIKQYRVHDRLHRTDGPAVEYPDGAKCWFINDEELSEEEFLHRTNPCTLPDYLK